MRPGSAVNCILAALILNAFLSSGMLGQEALDPIDLIESLDDSDPRVRRDAILSLRTHLDPAKIPDLIEVVTTRSLHAQLSMREVIAESTTLIGGLLAALFHDSDAVRSFAVETVSLLSDSLQHRRRFDGMEDGTSRRHRRVYLEASAVSYLSPESDRIGLWSFVTLTRYLLQDRPVIFDPRIGEVAWDLGLLPFEEAPAEVVLEEVLEARKLQTHRLPSFHWIATDPLEDLDETRPRLRLRTERQMVRSLAESLASNAPDPQKLLALDGLCKIGVPALCASVVRTLQGLDPSRHPEASRYLRLAIAFCLLSGDTGVDSEIAGALLIDRAIQVDASEVEVRLVMDALRRLPPSSVEAQVLGHWTELTGRCVNELSLFCAFLPSTNGLNRIRDEWDLHQDQLSKRAKRVVVRGLMIVDPDGCLPWVDVDRSLLAPFHDNVAAMDLCGALSEDVGKRLWSMRNHGEVNDLWLALAKILNDQSFLASVAGDLSQPLLLRLRALEFMDRDVAETVLLDDSPSGKWVKLLLWARRAEGELSAENLELIRDTARQWNGQQKDRITEEATGMESSEVAAVLGMVVPKLKSREAARALMDVLEEQSHDRVNDDFTESLLDLIDRVGYVLSLGQATQVGILRGEVANLSEKFQGARTALLSRRLFDYSTIDDPRGFWLDVGQLPTILR